MYANSLTYFVMKFIYWERKGNFKRNDNLANNVRSVTYCYLCIHPANYNPIRCHSQFHLNKRKLTVKVTKYIITLSKHQRRAMIARRTFLLQTVQVLSTIRTECMASHVFTLWTSPWYPKYKSILKDIIH